MFATADEILRQLLAGEDSRTEFKRVDFKGRRILGPDRDNVAAGLVAFANAEGGTFFLGVDDSGTATGVPREKLDLVEQWVVNIATDLCDPPIRPVLRRAVVPGPSGDVAIVLAEIRRGLYVHRTSRGRYYLRAGSTRRDLDPTELARLFQDRSREFVFDERKVFAASADDLSRTRLEAHFGISPTIPWPDLLRNTRVTIRDRDEVDRPSVAGLLSFGRDPTDTLASAYIEAACYGGTRLSSDDLVRAERLGGPVSDQIDAGIAFVMHFMRAGRDGTEDDAYDHRGGGRGRGQRRGPPGLLRVRFEDPSVPVRGSAGAVQPGQAAQRNHDRADAVPHVHPQPAPGQLPVEDAQQADRAGVPGVAGGGGQKDPRGWGGALGGGDRSTSCSGTSCG